MNIITRLRRLFTGMTPELERAFKSPPTPAPEEMERLQAKYDARARERWFERVEQARQDGLHRKAGTGTVHSIHEGRRT